MLGYLLKTASREAVLQKKPQPLSWMKTKFVLNLTVSLVT